MIDYLLLDLDSTLYPQTAGLGQEMSRLMTKFVAGYLGIPADEAEERLPVPVHTTLFVDDVVQYLLPFRDLGGMIVHMATPGFGTNEIPTISTLRDLVSIIYPDRSRG